ncbi:MAG: 50S ribosomal protein L19 [Candidatus Sungbacteria bacterium RIFCSPHIGHO2_02_FULL_49_12]|uniref:Large ribosomal subunit protein bL19 n=1 Tax=Candidatus Sungbacteria bacterium RIFCSPHIGHO2_02_FULL_49_12 TaxID=1802271 RepID=A0A1G2KNW1_9BACT|nr:MAG: 50S ribosomal protein L19 [Candidatus Sungbacteria bacterium RIFCSPHIGHO2_02_FULL_49_12]
MTQQLLNAFTKDHLKTLRVDPRPGDTVRVMQKIKEGDKFRTQAFEGTVIAVKHGTGITATFTVRKVSDGYGVERIFPFHSPMIEKIQIVKRANVRRAKLYYIRNRAKRDIRKKMKLIRDTAPAGVAKESKE